MFGCWQIGTNNYLSISGTNLIKQRNSNFIDLQDFNRTEIGTSSGVSLILIVEPLILISNIGTFKFDDQCLIPSF